MPRVTPLATAALTAALLLRTTSTAFRLNIVRRSALEDQNMTRGGSSPRAIEAQMVDTFQKSAINIQGIEASRYCVVSCPGSWLAVGRNVRKTTRLGEKYIEAATGAKAPSADVSAKMKDLNSPLYEQFSTSLVGQVSHIARSFDSSWYLRSQFTMMQTFLSSQSELERCVWYLAMKAAELRDGRPFTNAAWFTETFPNCEEVIQGMVGSGGAVPPPEPDGLEAQVDLLNDVWADAANGGAGESADLWSDTAPTAPTVVLQMNMDGDWEATTARVERGFVAQVPTVSPAFPAATKPTSSTEDRLPLDHVRKVRYTQGTYLEMVRPGLPPVHPSMAQVAMDCVELFTDVRVYAFASPNAADIRALHATVEAHRAKLTTVAGLSHALSMSSKMLALAYVERNVSAMMPERETEVLRVGGRAMLEKPAATSLEELDGDSADPGSLAEVSSHVANAVALIERDERHEEAKASFAKAMDLVKHNPALEEELSAQFASFLQTDAKAILEGVAAGYILTGGGGVLGAILVGLACSQSTDGCFTVLIAMLARAATG